MAIADTAPLSFLNRSASLELLDNPTSPPDDIRHSLNFMTGINRFFGGTRAVLDYFERERLNGEVRVVDLGCGSGDIPHALVNWGMKRGLKIRVAALDINPVCLEYARRRYASPSIEFLNHSAFEFEKLGTFDYAVSSMFFHHLDDERIVWMFKKMAGHCRKGFVVNDLYRCRPGYWGAALLGSFSGKYMVYHDAKLSVARAFREEDGTRYSLESGVNLRVERRPSFRLRMSWSRRDGHDTEGGKR